MREPRRDYYIPPATGDDTRGVLDQASQALRELRGFPADDDPGVALHVLASLVAEAQSRLPAAVARARNQGYSWAQVADLLGLTRASVWQRYAAHSSTNGGPTEPSSRSHTPQQGGDPDHTPSHTPRPGGSIFN